MPGQDITFVLISASVTESSGRTQIMRSMLRSISLVLVILVEVLQGLNHPRQIVHFRRIAHLALRIRFLGLQLQGLEIHRKYSIPEQGIPSLTVSQGMTPSACKMEVLHGGKLLLGLTP